MKDRITYGVEATLSTEDFARLLTDSGLGATRPVADLQRLEVMLRGANVLLTARRGGSDGPLVGVIRGISDGAWCCYISEIAVSRSAQGLGIGKGLLKAARRQVGPEVSVILASLPESVAFYERIGMPRMENAFWYRRRY